MSRAPVHPSARDKPAVLAAEGAAPRAPALLRCPAVHYPQSKSLSWLFPTEPPNVKRRCKGTWTQARSCNSMKFPWRAWGQTLATPCPSAGSLPLLTRPCEGTPLASPSSPSASQSQPSTCRNATDFWTIPVKLASNILSPLIEGVRAAGEPARLQQRPSVR